MTATTMTIRRGGCLCGAIRYRATGEPIRTSLCYCTQCRRQTGSAMPAFATFAATALEVEQGAPAGYSASPRAVRQFCPACGSALFWREHDGGEVDVFLGSFDQPEALPPPARQIWTMHRLPWVTAVAAIPGFTEQNG